MMHYSRKLIKHILLCSFFTMETFFAVAQEQYDITSFNMPEGWKKERAETLLSFSRIDGGSWAQMAIYKSTTSKGSIEADMQSEWDNIVLKQHTVEKEESTAAQQADGRYVMSRSGVWQFNGTNVATILTTYSNNTICISVLCNATAQPYLKDYQNLIKSLELNVENASVVAPAENTTTEASVNTASENNTIAGLWGSYINETSGYINGMPQTTGGYFRKEYTFNTDGSYVFLEKNFSAYNKNIVFKYEEGSWTQNGSQLTLSPSGGRTETWSKHASGRGEELGRFIQTGKLKAQKTTYGFEIKNLSGMGKNYLVLTHNQPTERDGTQNNNGGQQSWQYSSEPVESAMIKMPVR